MYMDMDMDMDKIWIEYRQNQLESVFGNSFQHISEVRKSYNQF